MSRRRGFTQAGLSVSGGQTLHVPGLAYEQSGWAPDFCDTVAETVRVRALLWPGSRWHQGNEGQAWAAWSFMCWRKRVQSGTLWRDKIRDVRKVWLEAVGAGEGEQCM